VLNQPGLFDTARESALDAPLVLVDLETTGTNPTRDRIIEIGLLQIENGREQQRWSTLVNPERGLSEFIEGYTGITSEMVAEAQVFAKIARELLQLLQGRTLVAHNARFDYGFLKSEFHRLGYTFQAPLLCTVRLSRKLYPKERKHNLDAVIARHDLSCASRHRALDDAAVLKDFLHSVRRQLPFDQVEKAVRTQLKSPSLPSSLPSGAVDAIPSGPGVYRFYDAEKRLLYVGKSINLRQRVQSHFSGDHRSPKGLRLSQQLAGIEWSETAGELGALLLEAQQIKELNPIHNRQLRRHNSLCSWQISPPGADFIRPELVTLKQLEAIPFDQLFGLYRTRNAGLKALRELVDEHRLCAKKLGLEKGKGACFAYQLKKCQGACIDEEPALLHNARLLNALAKQKVQDWPFSGPVGIRERHPANGMEQIILLDRWCHLGTAKDEQELQHLIETPTPLDFDLDRYKILRRFFREQATKLDLVVCPPRHATGQLSPA